MAQLQPYDMRAPTTLLTDEELNEFFDDLDDDGDGFITFTNLNSRLEQVHKELYPESRNRFSNFDSSTDTVDCEKGSNLERRDLDIILQALFPKLDGQIPRKQFVDSARSWKIPSQLQNSIEQEDAEHSAFESRLSWSRAMHARWIVQGPKTLFNIFVVLLQIGFGTWQGIEFIRNPQARAAMGWGVVFAKFCAGALYPTMFFLILSMSRKFATFMRRFHRLSRVIDWDRNQSFHIWMAATAIVLATIHAISHLTGSFACASEPGRRSAMASMMHQEDMVEISYIDFLRSVPAWTGIASLSCFWLMAMLSMPATRRRLPYEIFQCAHLLMFPIMGLLSIHGVNRMLGQFPMLGFWLVIPGLLVFYERFSRLLRGFFGRVPAHIRILDDDLISITCLHPGGKNWQYQVGQYILLQVPALSLFQWHPFTVSACSGNRLQLHIKTSGDWTGSLRTLPFSCQVGVDGPFGAPSQRFYQFNKNIVIGSGVGITPFAAIVADLVQHANKKTDPWAHSRRSSRQSRNLDVSSPSGALSPVGSHESSKSLYSQQRRVDLHWMVREENHLGWFSSLLNYAYETFAYGDSTCLQLNINTYVTGRRKTISTHVFRYLLDAHRTPSNPVSALTGLKMRSRFHRPNLQGILQKFHNDVKRETRRRERIGVFFCGCPRIGRILADLCAQLTLQSRRDGSDLVYVFVTEVFK